MFEKIGNFFNKMIKPEVKELASKDAAKERLHLVLMQDRANVSVDFLELMKQEIIDVIKKYIVVDENAIDVRLTNQENEDGTNGAPSLYANIPIINIKNDVKGEKIKDGTLVYETDMIENSEEIEQTSEPIELPANSEELKQEEVINEVVENVAEETIIENIEETEENKLDKKVEEKSDETQKEETIITVQENNIEEKVLEDMSDVSENDIDEEDDEDVTFDDLLKKAEEEEAINSAKKEEIKENSKGTKKAKKNNKQKKKE